MIDVSKIIRRYQVQVMSNDLYIYRSIAKLSITSRPWGLPHQYFTTHAVMCKGKVCRSVIYVLPNSDEK